MLARFDRYVLGQLMVVFGFFAFVIVMIYWVNRAITLFDRLVGDGQSVRIFIEFTLLIIPFLLFIILPLAAFAAAINVANRLSSESEMVVLRSSGISAFRMARASFVFGVLVCTVMLILSHVLVPIARAQLALREADLAEDVTAQFLEEGRFLFPAAGVAVFIGEITPGGVLERVLLSDARRPDARVIYTADQALLVKADDGPRLVMIDGLAQSLDADDALSVLSFQDFAFNLGELATPAARVIRDLRAYPTRALLQADPALLEVTGFSEAQFLHEAHTRTSKPLAAIFIAVIGFSCLLIGSFSRFGFWQQVAFGVLLLVALQLINNAAENAAQSDVQAWPLLYAPVLAGALISAAMLTLADQPLMARLRAMRAAP
jgi:lipopolysaccharide export system permease protein